MSNERAANTEQLAAIKARNPLVTVSAGAGTGKTWTLASRYVSLLGECGVGDILTLTFTEKAAQEMRERIEKMILESQAAQNIFFEESYISTIHSFAWRMLREAGLSIDVSPSSNIISAPQRDEFQVVFSRALDERLDLKILSQYSPESVVRLAAQCEDIHSAMGRRPDDFLRLCSDDALRVPMSELRTWLIPYWNECWDVWHKIFDSVKNIIIDMSKKKKVAAYVLNFQVMMSDWSGVNFSDENARKFFTELFERLLNNVSWGDISETIGEILGVKPGEWRDVRKKQYELSTFLDIEELKRNYVKDFSEREEFIRICAEYWELFERKRRNDGLLSFSDLIEITAESAPQGKFKHIMIDEFQDTDPLQEKMARRIAGEAQVFVVGDPKQSIYRFRNADLNIFAKYAEDARSGDNLYINMNRSFRMRSALYEGINALFCHVWPHSLGRLLPNLRYENLEGLQNELRDSETIPPLCSVFESKIIDNDGKKEPVRNTRKRLAARLAGAIYGWHESGVTVWDGECNRPLEWGDCAVLTPVRTMFPDIDEALSYYGIPVNIDNGSSWFSYGEVSDVVNMLRAAAFPNDLIAHEGWRRSIFAPKDDADALFMIKIAEIRGASGLLEHLLDNTAWLRNVRLERRNRTIANIRHAASLAREYEQSIYRTLPGCAEWLSNALRTEQKFDEPIMDDGGNSVKLLTVHASKGLEFPVVFLYGIERSPIKNAGGRSSLIASKHLGAFASSHKAFSAIHKALDEEASIEENQRLFYVAATRAKDCLVFCGVKDGEAKKGSWLDFIQSWENFEKYVEPIKARASEHHVTPQHTYRNIRLTLPIGEHPLLRLSATSFAMYEWCPFAWRRRYRQGLRLDWENYSDIALGSDVGSILHWVLARWDFTHDAIPMFLDPLNADEFSLRLPPSLRGSFRKLCSSKNELEIALTWLGELAGSSTGELMRILIENKKLVREKSFSVVLPDGVKLVGSADLYWENENGINIRDWKTSSKMDKMYDNQLLFYAAALRRMLDKPIVSLALLSVRNGEEFPVELDLLDDIERRITEASKNATSIWGANKRNCNSCGLVCGV